MHIDLSGNNCTVFGGNETAAQRAETLLRFGAKVTVISPTLCAALEEMSARGVVRHIPRKYFRGDCSNAQLCIAADEDADTNIRIATECKAKSVPVNVVTPKGYGTFHFPCVIFQKDMVITVDGDASAEKKRRLRDKISDCLSHAANDIEQK